MSKTKKFALVWMSSILIMFGVPGREDFARSFGVEKGGQLTNDGIPSVSYCDLISNQATYEGKPVRMKVVLLSYIDSQSVYDPDCAQKGLEPVLDCSDQEECAVMQKQLAKHRKYNGDVGRVEAVVICSFVAPKTSGRFRSRGALLIKKIERTSEVSSDVPWPGDKP